MSQVEKRPARTAVLRPSHVSPWRWRGRVAWIPVCAAQLKAVETAAWEGTCSGRFQVPHARVSGTWQEFEFEHSHKPPHHTAHTHRTSSQLCWATAEERSRLNSAALTKDIERRKKRRKKGRQVGRRYGKRAKREKKEIQKAE